eukprot:CAMPEP_0172710788 /NCGR_PEP_ID=MMETSP1074-20121228/56801_1 /TAXON_ID=2916 /ORGANISM="Ceratium fusus, Strain PA161109" /LENGTH=93 /DNA_ID=CAMNT_0013534287 /DNA_START=92 /DNA_END=373 /DNA_ORIENTATION=-
MAVPILSGLVMPLSKSLLDTASVSLRDNSGTPSPRTSANWSKVNALSFDLMTAPSPTPSLRHVQIILFRPGILHHGALQLRIGACTMTPHMFL